MPLSLFRRRKKKHEEEQAPPPATPAPESKPAEPSIDAAQAPSPPVDGQPAGPPKQQRRRGTRGGKGRSRAGAKAADGATATATPRFGSFWVGKYSA